MAREVMSSARLEAFSDGVIAIIVTIMVLDLKAPVGGGVEALLALWPVFLSYALSFLTVAIYWMNHHRTFHLAKQVDVVALWCNLLLLFTLSLIPFATAYMGANHLSSLSVAIYCALLMLCTLAFVVLRMAMARHFGTDAHLRAWSRAAARKGWLAIAVYAAGIPVAYVRPSLALLLCFSIAALYFIPGFGTRARET